MLCLVATASLCSIITLAQCWRKAVTAYMSIQVTMSEMQVSGHSVYAFSK